VLEKFFARSILGIPISTVIQTYFFWFAVSLLNFNFLIGLAIPVLAIFYFKFFAFLLIPLALSAACVAFISKQLALRQPLILNAIFLILILFIGDLFKNTLIWWQLRDHNPQCVDYGSFTRSVFLPNNQFVGHAIFEEGGYVFLWSYSTMSFYAARPNLAVNFSCKNSPPYSFWDTPGLRAIDVNLKFHLKRQQLP
jgi:hypothetical protein